MRHYSLCNNTSTITLDYTPVQGHELGQCQFVPLTLQGFVHIPKNASTEMKELLKHWKSSNYKQQILNEYIVILRDPRDRWISGMAEFLIGNNSSFGRFNQNWATSTIDARFLVNHFLLRKLITTDMMFDPHTMPQCLFLENVPYDKIKYFMFNKNVVDQIADYLSIPIESKKYLNNSSNNKIKMSVVDELNLLLEQDPELSKKLDQVYYCDHELLDILTS